MGSLRTHFGRTRFARTFDGIASLALLTDSLRSHFRWTSFARTFGRLASLATAAPDVNSSDLAWLPLLLALALALDSAHRSLLQPAVAALRLLRACGCCGLKGLNRKCYGDVTMTTLMKRHVMILKKGQKAQSTQSKRPFLVCASLC